MGTVKNNLSPLSEKQKESAINEIIAFFEIERGEKIGVIAAEAVLDMFLENTAASIYNKGVDDTKNFITEGFEKTNADVEVFIKKGLN
jgi:uncharacterized protein (DUF2164 family)